MSGYIWVDCVGTDGAGLLGGGASLGGAFGALGAFTTKEMWLSDLGS